MKDDRKQIQNRVGFELRKLDLLMTRSLEAKVKARGIDAVTLMHGWIIRYLYENRDKDIYQKDIERHCVIGRSTVTNIIQLMEKKGYVKRESVESDARLKKVILTEKGIESHETIELLIDRQNEKMLEGIRLEEMENFLRMAERIRKNIDQNERVDSIVKEDGTVFNPTRNWKEEEI